MLAMLADVKADAPCRQGARVERWKNLRYGYENTRVLNSGYAVAVSVDAAWALVAQFEPSPP
jgi:hypothetical protein